MTDLPPRLARRPFDGKRKVPVPFFNVMPDGSVNFTGINAETVIRCAQERLCGICGEPLDYWIAFIGGPVSAATRCYTDPPMHRECAEAAVRYCPHINRRVHRRTPDEKFDPDDTWASSLAEQDKPASWVISITRDFKTVPHEGFFFFQAATVKEQLIYSYGEDGHIHPVKA